MAIEYLKVVVLPAMLHPYTAIKSKYFSSMGAHMSLGSNNAKSKGLAVLNTVFPHVL